VAGPFERGQEFGSVHSGQVRTTIEAYQGFFEMGADGDLALKRIEEWAPSLAEEIRGVASGAGVPVGHVAAINARTELLARVGVDVDECSTVVALGGAVAAQNWDWYIDMADNWLEWTIPFPDGRRVTTITEYGIVGKIGLNAHGVGVLFNILHHRDDGAGIGVPVHVVSRQLLDTCDSVDAAIALARTARVSASTNITVVSGSAAAAVELWPGGPGVVPADESGFLVHTNHFLAPAARAGDLSAELGSDTRERYGFLAGALHGRSTPAQVHTALTDHASGVCCHPLAGEVPPHATLATITLDLAAGTVTTTPGTPCTTPDPPPRRS
jgi:isopenicillin-N N-acyltransferase-like protein